MSALIKLPSELRTDLSTCMIQAELLHPEDVIHPRPHGELHTDLSSSGCPPQGEEKDLKLLFIARLVNFLSQNLFSQPLLQTSPDIWLLYMINSQLSSCEHE